MKIEEVILAVWKKRREVEALTFGTAHLGIYMTYDYRMECRREFAGQVARAAFDFYESDTIMGYPVWVVTEGSHPPFRIVDLGEAS